MSNRAGKREREAGNRHKRGTLSTAFLTRNGREWQTVKLGRKKIGAVLRSSMPGFRQLERDMAAVPVDDQGNADQNRRMRCQRIGPE